MVAFNRVVLSGTLASGQETWSTSCAFGTDTEAPVSAPSQLNTWAEAIVDAIATDLTLTELKNGLGAQGALTSVKCYFYPSTTSGAAAVGEAASTTAGSIGSSRSTTTAMVLSLGTGLAGRRYRGRMYWPAMSNTITTTGRFTGTVCGNAANEAVDLLTAIADAAPTVTPVYPVVVSTAGDFITQVIQVKVGDVPDAQRSRRDALLETYFAAAI